jgi:hypothetical protein
VTGTPPNITYTPGTNYFGPNSFTYQASDGSLRSNTATVTVTVAHVLTCDDSITPQARQVIDLPSVDAVMKEPHPNPIASD